MGSRKPTIYVLEDREKALSHIEQLELEFRMAEYALAAAVVAMHKDNLVNGLSNAEIGEAVGGVTKQSVNERFGRKSKWHSLWAAGDGTGDQEAHEAQEMERRHIYRVAGVRKRTADENADVAKAFDNEAVTITHKGVTINATRADARRYEERGRRLE